MLITFKTRSLCSFLLSALNLHHCITPTMAQKSQKAMPQILYHSYGKTGIAAFVMPISVEPGIKAGGRKFPGLRTTPASGNHSLLIKEYRSFLLLTNFHFQWLTPFTGGLRKAPPEWVSIVLGGRGALVVKTDLDSIHPYSRRNRLWTPLGCGL